MLCMAFPFVGWTVRIERSQYKGSSYLLSNQTSVNALNPMSIDG